MQFGYGRLSHRHGHDEQRALLLAAGCRRIVFDQQGQVSELEAIKNMLATYPASTSPILTVCSLDRAAKNMTGLLALIAGLHEKGIGFRSLAEKLEISPDRGREAFQTIAALIQFRRAIAVEKSDLGVRAAEEKDRQTGRRAKLDAKAVKKAAREIGSGRATVADMAAVLHVSVPTLYRYLAAFNARRD
jgi:DNA invertase Pin-like site-specific DNA recombinase